MAVMYDGVSNNVGTGTSITVSHTTGSGANRFMLVWVFVDSGAAFEPTVTVDSVSATKIAEVETSRYIGLFRYASPGSGTNSVVVSSLPGGGAQGVVVVTFDGVDQTTSVDTPQSANAGTSSPPVTINASSVSGDMVVDALHLNNISNNLQATAANQTARANVSNTSQEFGVSTKPGETSAAMTWSWTSASAYAQMVVNVKSATVAALNDALIVIRQA